MWQSCTRPCVTYRKLKPCISCVTCLKLNHVLTVTTNLESRGLSQVREFCSGFDLVELLFCDHCTCTKSFRSNRSLNEGIIIKRNRSLTRHKLPFKAGIRLTWTLHERLKSRFQFGFYSYFCYAYVMFIRRLLLPVYQIWTAKMWSLSRSWKAHVKYSSTKM